MSEHPGSPAVQNAAKGDNFSLTYPEYRIMSYVKQRQEEASRAADRTLRDIKRIHILLNKLKIP